MVEVFELALDPCPGEGGFYGPGSVVSGVLRVQVDDPSAFNDIRVKFKGKGHCHWTTTSGTGENQTTEEHTGKEKYFKEKIVLWKQEHDPTRVILSGVHSFPFQFTFPTDKVLPSSFDRSIKDDLGRIRYAIKAGISCGDEVVCTAKAKLPFHEVVPVSSLNSPVEREDEKAVGCLCCIAGVVTIKIDLPRTGFRERDSVPATINVENNCTREVTMSAAVLEKITYTADGAARKYHTRTIANVDLGEPIQPRATRMWNTEQLVVPPSTVLSQSSSAVIKVVHVLAVSGSIPWSLGSRQEIPIVIGNK